MLLWVSFASGVLTVTVREWLVVENYSGTRLALRALSDGAESAVIPAKPNDSSYDSSDGASACPDGHAANLAWWFDDITATSGPAPADRPLLAQLSVADEDSSHDSSNAVGGGWAWSEPFDLRALHSRCPVTIPNRAGRSCAMTLSMNVCDGTTHVVVAEDQMPALVVHNSCAAALWLRSTTVQHRVNPACVLHVAQVRMVVVVGRGRGRRHDRDRGDGGGEVGGGGGGGQRRSCWCWYWCWCCDCTVAD